MPARRRGPQGCWLSGLQIHMTSFYKIRKPEGQQQNAKLLLREPLAHHIAIAMEKTRQK